MTKLPAPKNGIRVVAQYCAKSGELGRLLRIDAIRGVCDQVGVDVREPELERGVKVLNDMMAERRFPFPPVTVGQVRALI